MSHLFGELEHWNFFHDRNRHGTDRQSSRLVNWLLNLDLVQPVIIPFTCTYLHLLNSPTYLHTYLLAYRCDFYVAVKCVNLFSEWCFYSSGDAAGVCIRTNHNRRHRFRNSVFGTRQPHICPKSLSGELCVLSPHTRILFVTMCWRSYSEKSDVLS